MESPVGDDVQVPEDDVVDPWTVSSSSDKGVDYDKLISMQFSVLAICFMILIILVKLQANYTRVAA